MVNDHLFSILQAYVCKPSKEEKEYAKFMSKYPLMITEDDENPF